MAKRRGGGIFTYVTDPITGATEFTTFTYVLIVLLFVGIVLAIVLPLTLIDRHKPETRTGGGAVAPPMSQQPGRINIAEVAQSPSAGQAIIYFSQAEASGTTCDTCTAEFDVNISYVGGQPNPAPVFKKVTAPALSGTTTLDYSVSTQTGGTTPPLPTPPTQINLSITSRSVNPQNGVKGAPTTFSKTLPYVA